MAKQIVVTSEGLRKLEEELEQLKEVIREVQSGPDDEA